MTVNTLIADKTVQGDGSTTTFPLNFPIIQASDAYVVHIDANDNETELAVNVDYSLASLGIGNLASITYPLAGSPLPVGESLRIQRQTQKIQETDLVAGRAFNAENIEAALDKLTLMAQDIEQNQTLLPGIVNLKSFGAVGDGVTDDTTAVQDAIDWCVGNDSWWLYKPAGVYAVTSLTDTQKVVMWGPGVVKPSGAFQTDEYGSFLRAGVKRGTTNPVASRGGFIVGGEGPYFPDGHAPDGVLLKSQYNSSMDFMASRDFNPIESQWYPNKITGICTTDGSNPTLTFVSGFDGDLDSGFYVGDTVWVGGTSYTILAKPSTTTLTLDGTPAAYASGVSCHILYRTFDSVVSITGTAVAWVAGDLLHTGTTDANMIIDGVKYTYTPIDAYSGTLSSAPGDETSKRVILRNRSDEDYIEIIRLQGLLGQGTEETFSLSFRPYGVFFRNGRTAGGVARYHPVGFIGAPTDNDPAPNNDDPQTHLYFDREGRITTRRRSAAEAEQHWFKNFPGTQGNDDAEFIFARWDYKWNGVAGSRRALDFEVRNNSRAIRIQGRSGTNLGSTARIELQPDGGEVTIGANFVATSDEITGGSGSAGAGNQFVRLTINGTTYKVLHDGTV